MKTDKLPVWLNNAVFYEIYPQSFKDSNGDGIGDLKGIIQKLDYIKTLGFNAVWLNPCFDSPFTDAGYDVRDYKKIAPRYGTNEDMKQLIDEVHKRDMHIILDLVPGHTSAEHEWFRQSMKPERNEFTDRYIWTNSIWESTEGIPCIRGISDRDGSAGVNFFSTQPALNYGYADRTRDYMQAPNDEAPMAARAAIKDVMSFWLDMGCDGFRVDMAGSLVKNDPDGSENIKLWQDFRQFLDEKYPHCAMISEWGEPEKSIAGGFHMDFLLHFGPMCYTSLFRSEKPFFSKTGGDISVFRNEYQKFYDSADGRGLICIPSSNHDMDRIARYRDTDDLKVCFAFLLSMCGAPFVYYGDEIGMNYVEGLTSVEGGFGRTGSRTPMQWDKTLNAGFSACQKTLIPLDPSPDRPDVLSSLADKGSLLNTVSELIAVRQTHSAMQNFGGFEFIYAEKDKYPLIYRRFDDNEEIFAVINPLGKAAECSIGICIDGDVLFKTGGEINTEAGKISVPPCSAFLIKTK